MGPHTQTNQLLQIIFIISDDENLDHFLTWNNEGNKHQEIWKVCVRLLVDLLWDSLIFIFRQAVDCIMFVLVNNKPPQVS